MENGKPAPRHEEIPDQGISPEPSEESTLRKSLLDHLAKKKSELKRAKEDLEKDFDLSKKNPNIPLDKGSIEYQEIEIEKIKQEIEDIEKSL